MSIKFEEELKNLNQNYKECCEYYCENQQDQSDKFGEKIMKILRCLYKNKEEKLAKIEKMKKAEEQKYQKQNTYQVSDRSNVRNDKVNKTWVSQNQQNQGINQNHSKNIRESYVEKEIKEMQQFKKQSRYIK